MVSCMTVGMLAGCGGGSSSGSDSKTIKIGVFEPTTGENGGGGFQEVLGIRYANKIHPTVKIGDTEYNVELVEVDNKSDKTEAVNAAQKLVSDKVSVVLGSYGSGVSIAAGQIFADAKIPAIGCSCTNPQVTQGNDYYFRTCFIDPFQGTVMANYAVQNGAKKAAVITQLGDDYSSGLGSFFKSAFVELGGEIVSEEQFQTNQTDFKAILTNVKAAEPDIIFAPSSITTAPLIIKQARELGLDATIAAGDTWENSTIIENAGSSAEGVVLSTFFDESEPANDEAAAFIKGFKEYLKENKQEEIIPAVSALGYDAYLSAIKAIEEAGSTDTTAIRDALKTVSIDGVTGTITFDENGDAKKDMAFIKTIENGAFKFLTTTTIQ
ncbi:ABC transporter substrate-binding protein [Clostridium sp. AM58-1XD]|uniref:ABC transporter substrate-binding protein n=1 Tax=Clostridium sp. AM58-1XD TaxID=2292307 RepID=UPI000E4EE8BA|nr:ABC transporter substrate-binding protein [Clostridium sp. AM58-1XD]RGY96086.1 amino acid ABC transporter substrate-binding protein [Clostridium sp. AM58-1XD]